MITKDGTVALIPSGPVPPYRPSADLLLTTMALVLGPRLVAVVLSGDGNDAATGATAATAVHRFGRTVIATTLETSSRTTMPRATINRDHITDHVVALDEVAALVDRPRHCHTTPSIEACGTGGAPLGAAL